MHDMGRNSWLDVVKKAFGSPTKTIKLRRREDHDDHKNRRWIFKKTCLHETTTILHHDESNTKIRWSTATNSMSYSFENHKAALVIQTSFRGYLARRALEALKGVVKLQALVRGHNVRMRANTTLKCLQALLRVQARVCDQRSRKLSTSPSNSINIREECTASYRIKDIQTMLHKTQVASQQDAEVNIITQRDVGLECETKFNDPAVKMGTCLNCSLSPNQTYYYQYQQQRFNSNPFSSSPQRLSPITTSSISRLEPLVKVQSSSPRSQRNLSGKPSYMSTTASAMARIRQPRQRKEGEKQIPTRKRLSFSLYVHGVGGGVSDSELDRSPFHVMERRLSTS